jgi:hypothetical protein
LFNIDILKFQLTTNKSLFIEFEPTSFAQLGALGALAVKKVSDFEAPYLL